MTFYAALLLIAAAMSGVITALAWRRRWVVAARPFALLMLAVTEWTLAYVLELASSALSMKVFWVKVQYLGIAFVPVAWLAFSLAYTDRKRWLTLRNIALLSLVPVAAVMLIWTNPLHHLMMESIHLVEAGFGSMLSITRGPAFWPYAVYAYALLLSGTGLLVSEYFRAGLTYRRQSRLLLIAALVPWLGNVLHIFGQGTLSYLDFTSFLFTISGILAFVALYRFQFLDLMPVAQHTVLEGMRDGVLVLDAENRVADLNPAAEYIVGVVRADAVGRSLGQVLSAWPNLIECLRGVTEGQAEITIPMGEGKRIYGLDISPLQRADAHVAGRLILFRDITERKRTESILQRRATELQARNEELDAFAHTVAHDLKDPLTTIVGFAEVLADYDPGLPADARDLLEAISASGRKMGSIIDELLLLSSVRQMDDVELEPLDMHAIVMEVLRRLKGMTDDYQAEIVLPKTWPTAVGYGPWVEEVWVNYISNAIKYGGSHPRVTLGATREGAGSIRFWVRDNGPGLTDEEQELLYTPFTQLDRSRVEGHGLGLSIVQRIVNRLGGRVVVESQVGEGSVFGFILNASDKVRP